MCEPERLTMGLAHDGLYLYCLVRSDDVSVIGGLGADTETPLLFHTFGGIAAVFCRVSLQDFCGESGERRLENLEWVGPMAIRHEEVIEAMMAHSPVIPARFGTLFSSPRSLEDLLMRHEDVIMGFFDEVADKTEWAVKGLLDRDLAVQTVSSAILERESELLSALPPGKRYFEQKRLKARADRSLKVWVDDVSKIVCKDLLPHVSRFCERKIIVYIRDHHVEEVLNWAFLVPTGSLARFKDRVVQAGGLYEAKGLIFVLSGPWPPYSFSPLLEMG